MFLICDENDVIQDIASRKENLSRGFDYPNYKLYKNVNVGACVVGDKYVDGQILIDIAKWEERELKAQQHSLVSQEMREMAITKLKSEGKLPPDYTEV